MLTCTVVRTFNIAAISEEIVSRKWAKATSKLLQHATATLAWINTRMTKREKNAQEFDETVQNFSDTFIIMPAKAILSDLGISQKSLNSARSLLSSFGLISFFKSVRTPHGWLNIWRVNLTMLDRYYIDTPQSVEAMEELQTAWDAAYEEIFTLNRMTTADLDALFTAHDPLDAILA